MNSNTPIEPEFLMAYSDNALDDPELVKQIRESAVCKKWISEHRFLRIIMRNKKNTKAPQRFAPSKLKLFVAEELPPQEMVAIEQVLVTNDVLFDEYMGLRAVYLAESASVGVPEELDQRVLNLIRSNPLKSREITRSITEETRKNMLTTLLDTCLDFLSPRQFAIAGGFAGALIAAVIVGDKMGLYGSPDFHPLIVASLDNPEEVLTFRGGSTPKGISTNAKGEITSIVLPINPSLIEGLKKFNDDPSQDTALSLIRILNELVSKAKDNISELPKSKMIGFDPSSIDAVQIQPTLWDQIQANALDLETIMVSIVEQENTSAGELTKTSNSEAISHILYFSKVK